MRLPAPARTRILLIAGVLALAHPARAQLLSENFDDLSALPVAGWIFVDGSTPPLPWFRGNSGVFPAFSGSPASYIAQNFLSANFAGVVDTWMITPVIPLVGGETLSFRTRAELIPEAYDLEFRDGLSVLLGVGSSTSLGNFTTGLVELGPVLATGPYPTAWQLYTVQIPAIPGMTSGRIAFQYFAEAGSEASYIGIDSVTVTSPALDTDGDGVDDSIDNCPTVPNGAAQAAVANVGNQIDGTVLWPGSPVGSTIEASKPALAGGGAPPLGDGVGDACDNCTQARNPRVAAGFLTTNTWATLTGGQRDDDHDGYGNKCDGDFTPAGLTVGPLDTAQYIPSLTKSRSALTGCGSPPAQRCARYDLDEAGGSIGPGDTSVYGGLITKAKGPRCPACTGTGSVALPCQAGSAVPLGCSSVP